MKKTEINYNISAKETTSNGGWLNGEIDCTGTEEITCPWCGEAYGDSWECSDKSESEICDDCGKIFSYEREVTCTYSSERKKCSGKCSYGLSSEYSNPWIGNSNLIGPVNATTWTCKVCHDKKILTGPVAEDGKPYIIDMT